MFGAQYLSQRLSAPSYGFGSEDRPSPVRLAGKAAHRVALCLALGWGEAGGGLRAGKMPLRAW
jgi:hypothetical protein